MFRYNLCDNPISLAQDEDEHSRSGTLQSKMMGGSLVRCYLLDIGFRFYYQGPTNHTQDEGL